MKNIEHILKDLIEQTNDQNKNIQLNKKLETLNQKEEVSKRMFSTENEINNLKNKLEGSSK